MTGEGVAELFDAIDAAGEEYTRDYAVRRGARATLGWCLVGRAN